LSSTLDRLVAEKVMGWTVSTDPACKPPTMYLEGDMLWHAGGCVVWSPSADMNAAMEVEKAVRARSNNKHRLILIATSTGEYVAEFLNHEGIHANPATAICLAALAAVGVEYKESDNGQ